VPAETQLALKYATDTLDIPADLIIVDNQNRREYLTLGRSFTTVTLFDGRSGQFITLLVDPATHQVTNDMAKMDGEEAKAERARGCFCRCHAK
jgi:hypothetical protein